MLASCLERGRMFCVAQLKPGTVGRDECETVAGLGLIRASVENADGTSNLILQGLARVRLVNFVQHAPFPVSANQRTPLQRGKPGRAAALGDESARSLRPLAEGQKRRT